MHLGGVGQWEGAGHGPEYQETQLVVRGCGSGPWVVARLGWTGTITLLNYSFFFPNILTFTNHICQILRGLKTCLKLFNGGVDHLLGCGLCVAADTWPLQQFFDVVWNTDEDDKVDAIHPKGYALYMSAPF